MTDDRHTELLQTHLSHFTNSMRGLITEAGAAAALLKYEFEGQVTLSDSEKRELFEAIQHSYSQYTIMVNRVLSEQGYYQIKQPKKREG